MPPSISQPIPQFSDRLARSTSPKNGTSVLRSLSNDQQPTKPQNPFLSSDLETKSSHISELATSGFENRVSESEDMSSVLFDEVDDFRRDEGPSIPQSSSEQDRFDIDDRVFFTENGTLKWQTLGTYVVIPGAIGGAGRWIRQEVSLQSQPNPPVASTMWVSTEFYYSVILGFLAAIIGNFVLARLLLNINKNKLTYLGLSLIFGMFYSTVFAMGGQAVFSSEGKIDQNQAVALASNDPTVQQKAINSNQAIARNSTDPDVKEDAIESSAAIATSDTATSEVKEKAIETNREIATSSGDTEVKREAIEATEAIATDETTKPDVQQDAIEASQEIAVNSEDPDIQEQAIDTTVAIFEATEDTDTQIVAVQAITDLAIDSTEATVDESIRQDALNALNQIKTNVENLDQAVIDEINTAQSTIESR